MRNQKYKIIRVMGFGTFDGIHPGHLFFLKQLKRLGDEVYVVIARDRNVKRFKGKDPHFSEKKRHEALKEMRLVDRVLMGHSKDFYHWINKLQPDVIGLGYDQKANVKDLEKAFPDTKIVRLKALRPEKYKSSILREK
jgi:FAD synthetase